MAVIITTAQELYRAHGLKKANFIAFDKMHHSSSQEDVDFWLHVINQITVMNMDDLRLNDQNIESSR